ncbi:MAG: MerR family transcriptional regulator [Gammaproteobacteria bacterium]|nr:MAG: MerR family transcriptional regulator [Gammaproteobacteria bacterium]
MSKELATGLLDVRVELTLEQISELAHVERSVVIELVQEGALSPRGTSPEEWRFTGPALRRLQRGLRLQRDLGINAAGVALALELLEELDRLRARLRRLEGR